MDSNQFCGLTCHTVMAPGVHRLPRLAALARGLRAVPHRPGRRLVRASRSSRACARSSRWPSAPTRGPIPSPVHDLRPARETCEQCHWPQKFVGDKFVVRTKYARRREEHAFDHGARAEGRRAHREAARSASTGAISTPRSASATSPRTDGARSSPRSPIATTTASSSTSSRRTSRRHPPSSPGARAGRWTASTATTGPATAFELPGAGGRPGHHARAGSAASCPSSRRRRWSCCAGSTRTARRRRG